MPLQLLQLLWVVVVVVLVVVVVVVVVGLQHPGKRCECLCWWCVDGLSLSGCLGVGEGAFVSPHSHTSGWHFLRLMATAL